MAFKKISESQRFGWANRIIHWGMAFTLCYILLTVFLRMGWMHKDQLGGMASGWMEQNGGAPLAAKQASDLGKFIRKPMWSTHIIAGYVMIGFYLLRMALTFRSGLNYQNPFTPGIGNKERFKAAVYFAFYFCLGLSLVTGLLFVFGPKDWKEILAAVHMKGLYYVIPFIMLHIAGVVQADASTEPGIISKIVTGPQKR